MRLVPGGGRLLLCADDAEAAALGADAPCAVETFGLADGADWRAENVRYESGATTFDVTRGGRPAGSAALPLLGAFNVRNALAAVAAAAGAGVAPADALAALGRFHGVRRRLEVRGVVRGVTVYDDFAHHPTAVRETLQALRASGTAGRLWACVRAAVGDRLPAHLPAGVRRRPCSSRTRCSWRTCTARRCRRRNVSRKRGSWPISRRAGWPRATCRAPRR